MPIVLVGFGTTETMDIPPKCAKHWRIRSKNLSKPDISASFYKGVEVRNGPHGGKSQQDEGTTPLRGWEKMTIDPNVDQEGRTPRDKRRNDREVINTIAGGFAEGGSSNSAWKSTWGRRIRGTIFRFDWGCHLSPSPKKSSRVSTLHRTTPWWYWSISDKCLI